MIIWKCHKCGKDFGETLVGNKEIQVYSKTIFHHKCGGEIRCFATFLRKGEKNE